MPQKLSPAARKKKAARDLAYAKTPRRRAMKAENQKKRRDALKKGINIKVKTGTTTRVNLSLLKLTGVVTVKELKNTIQYNGN